MNQRNWIGYIMVLLFFLACKNDKNSSAEIPMDAESLPNQQDILADAGNPNLRNPRWYTYRHQDAIASANQVTVTKNIAVDSMYEISATVRPPLFHKNCLSAANPEQCSNEAVLDWMQYAVERPNIPAAQREKLMHYVAFTIDEKGEVNAAEVIAIHQSCEPCVAATKEAVAGMQTWIPALRDGKPVKVQVVLPVYYD